MKTKILRKTIKYKGKSIQVLNQVNIVSEDLSELVFEYVHRQNVALIIPILENKEIIIVRQYRAAVDRVVLEFPAGKQKEGESIEETALRELEEETGYSASNIFLIGEFFTSPHFSNERVFVYIAKGLNACSKQSFSDHEFINQFTMPFSKLEQAFDKEVIKDAKSIISLNYYKSFING